MKVKTDFETIWMERYQHLLAIHQAPARGAILEKCEITKDVFYNYLYGRTEVPVLVEKVLIEVFDRFESKREARIAYEKEKENYPYMNNTPPR